jgi:hypothetical protein
LPEAMIPALIQTGFPEYAQCIGRDGISTESHKDLA